ncbi:protein-tyrosine phosphatase [Meinhardsimonia xiamenensis]|jgi:protein-tyrosine phosphatase|uniref:protein-tyrosine-phosphatase n=1 Tax=Meinhardsimonia xiamenensis TaxID=990712 RepID=A0A1G9CAV1_9RHOB|nr:low molecular weight protein-tyrosine-phosphatase [Meinhardsimonia xiamenensis]PRX38426.1 protein-tyrosine phosphatase [Meinhardsimonia xiamenensis]SDK48800.1 protein-tyrosine phosphatase [Meinhardsimonia xiamenensis]
MVQSVLMVCLGNICRSPTAEAVLRRMAADAGLRLQVDSAGTGGWHVDKPPHPPAIRAAAARGYDLSALRARQVTERDFSRFDLIVAMDRDNLATLERLRPAGSGARLRLLLDYAGAACGGEVPDPYFTGDYETALDLIEAGCAGLVEALRRGCATQPQ